MQSVYSESLAQGYPGQRTGLNHEADTFINDLGSLAEVIDITIDTVTDAATYTLVLQGKTVAIVAAAGSTEGSIADQIIDAINEDLDFEGVVSANRSGDDVRVTFALGVDGTLTESDGKISLTTVQAYVAEQPIPFGRAVVKRTGAGTNDQSAQLPSAAEQLFLGVAERITSDADATNALAEIGPGRTMTVIRKGEVFVEVEDAVDYGAQLYFRHTGGVVGKFRSDDDGGDADLAPGVIARQTTTGPGLCKILLESAHLVTTIGGDS